MPDTLVRMSRDVFSNDDAYEAFLRRTAEVVAIEMSCRDDGGKPVELDPEGQIDPYIQFYDITTPRVSKIVLVVITAFDYENRMADIDDRVARVKNRLTGFLPRGYSVQITFLDFPEKCWAG